MPIINLVYEAPYKEQFYYDFRNSNVATVQGYGFTISNTSTLNFGNNGVKATNGNNCTCTKTVDYSKAKTIEIEATVYLETGSYRGAIISGPCLTTSWDSNFALGRIWASTYISRIIDNVGNYQGSGSENYYSGTPSSGSQTLKIVFDLENKTMISYRIINGNSISKESSLSDTQITNIKSCPYWRIELDAGSSSGGGGAYLSDIKLTLQG